jgi:hypothetical protein
MNVSKNHHYNRFQIFLDVNKKKTLNEEKQDDKQTLSIMGIPMLQ